MHKALQAIKGMMDGKNPPKAVKIKTKVSVKGPAKVSK